MAPRPVVVPARAPGNVGSAVRRRIFGIVLAAVVVAACGDDVSDLPKADEREPTPTQSATPPGDARQRQAHDLAERLEHALDRGTLDRDPLGAARYPARLTGTGVACLVGTRRDLAGRRTTFPDTVSATGPWIAACAYTGAASGRAGYERDLRDATSLLAG